MLYLKTIFNESYFYTSDIYIVYSQQMTKTSRINLVPDYPALCQGHKSNVLGRFIGSEFSMLIKKSSCF